MIFVMATNPPEPLTPRHLAVLGVLQQSPRDVSPSAIARVLHFKREEVLRLLDDLRSRGYTRLLTLD